MLLSRRAEEFLGDVAEEMRHRIRHPREPGTASLLLVESIMSTLKEVITRSASSGACASSR